MSSYLVALIVSDFNCINGTSFNVGSSGSLPVKVCARPNVPREELEYSLDVGIKIINTNRTIVCFPHCGVQLRFRKGYSWVNF